MEIKSEHTKRITFEPEAIISLLFEITEAYEERIESLEKENNELKKSLMTNTLPLIKYFSLLNPIPYIKKIMFQAISFILNLSYKSGLSSKLKKSKIIVAIYQKLWERDLKK